LRRPAPGVFRKAVFIAGLRNKLSRSKTQTLKLSGESETVSAAILMRIGVILRNVLLLSLMLAWPGSLQAQEADSKLNAFFKDYLEGYFRLRPLEATRMGDSSLRFLAGESSPTSRAAWTELSRKNPW